MVIGERPIRDVAWPFAERLAAHPRKSLPIVPFLWRDGGCDDVSRDFALARKEMVDLAWFGVRWDELRKGLAVLGDDDGFALGLDLVHYGQAIGLKESCRHFLHSPSLCNLGHYTVGHK